MRYTFDSRQIEPGMGFVALKGEKSDGHAFIPMARARGAVEVIDGLEALQDRARARRRALGATVVALTGSAGKTTTKEFLKAFLGCYGTEGNFNNHIGLPMTILNAPDDGAFLVLEMGTNHPGEIAALCDIAAPDVGAICSIGTAHLEFFRTQEGIAREKGTLFARTRLFNACPAAVAQKEVLAGLSGAVELLETPADCGLTCPLPGAHNASNMALAHAVALRLGVSHETCAARLRGFVLPGARWCRRTVGGVGFVDDSYNANPDAMRAALDAFARESCTGRRIAVLGDMFELGEGSEALHREVFRHAAGLGLDLVIGVGETSARCPCDRAFPSLEPLVRAFRDLVVPGDLVLLKASHSMELGKLMEAI